MTHSLTIEHISKAFDGTPVLHDLSLTTHPGEFVTLLGPSGCGKTTTLRLVAGFEQPDGGTIHIGERRVASAHHHTPPEERRVGMVFQDYALFPHVDVAGNIGFGLRGPGAERRQRVQTMLEMVGLADLAQRMPHELSGGQQQRVALARALAPEPALLLLDEPFSNLDTSLRKQVRAEVRTILRATGTTAIFVTHDQEEALSLADRAAVLFNGVLQQYDTPDRLYNTPCSPDVAAFVGEANLIPAQASGGRAQSPLGEVRLLQPAQGPVKLLIRPEILHLFTTDEGTPGRILWREYYGHNQRIGLELGDGTTLIVRTDAQISYRPGQTIRVSVYAPLMAYPVG